MLPSQSRIHDLSLTKWKDIRMIRKNLFAIFVLALVMVACQSTDPSRTTATSTQDDETAIRQLFGQMIEKWNADDLDGFMAHVADDVVQMPPGQPAVVGKEALHSAYEGFVSAYDDTWEPSIEHIEISGDLAIVQSVYTQSWTPINGGRTTTYSGKDIHVFRRGADGSWEMIIEIWNAGN